MITTVLCAILRIFSNSFLNAGQKHLSKRVSSLYTNFYTYFILSLISIPVFLLLYFKNINLNIIFWALVGGIFGALGNAFLISALKYGELSIMGPINSYKAIIGLIFGFILLKEIPDTQALAGIILIIFGSYFIFESEKEGFTFKIFLRRDIQFRILALVFTGIEAVFIKKVILLSDFICSFLLWVIFGCIFSYLILKIFKPLAPKEEDSKILRFIQLSFLVLIMQLSTNFVFSKIDVASALSIFQLSNILNVFLGYKIFKEENLLKKLTGSIIMVIGSVMIILG